MVPGFGLFSALFHSRCDARIIPRRGLPTFDLSTIFSGKRTRDAKELHHAIGGNYIGLSGSLSIRGSIRRETGFQGSKRPLLF